VIDRAYFCRLTDGGVYFHFSTQSMSIISTLFEECSGQSALYAQADMLRVNMTCFQYCDGFRDGKYITADMYGVAIFDECAFYASYPRGQSSSSSPGDAISFQAGLAVTYYARNENHTRSDCGSPTTKNAAIDSDGSLCIIDREFSIFVDCREDFILWIRAPDGPIDRIQYTSFRSNTVYESVLCSRRYGCVISHCIFAGNSPLPTFLAGLTGFVIMDCVFDSEPSGNWSGTGTGNAFWVTTATIDDDIVPCPEIPTMPPPVDSGMNVLVIAIPIAVVVLACVVGVIWLCQKRKNRYGPYYDPGDVVRISKSYIVIGE
jgi:hypothetical protein